MITPFTTHTGTVAPLRLENVDTDQIIPAEYMKRLTRTGFEDGLFQRWRAADPSFVLNRPEHAGASVLAAGRDFGIGSSREHAVWALRDYGFAVVLAPRFGDIFATNAGKNGLLVVTLGETGIEDIQRSATEEPAMELTVDLERQRITYLDRTITFTVDPQLRHQLLHGLDDIDLTLRRHETITTYERTRRAWLPHTR